VRWAIDFYYYARRVDTKVGYVGADYLLCHQDNVEGPELIQEGRIQHVFMPCRVLPVFLCEGLEPVERSHLAASIVAKIDLEKRVETVFTSRSIDLKNLFRYEFVLQGSTGFVVGSATAV
jgi:hypothetical protein